MNNNSASSSANSLPYRLGVGMMLLNQQNQVFVGRRIDTTSEAWQMPQGGIDEGEDEKKAALRELEEEVGTNHVELIAASKDWYYYDLPEEIIPRVWGGKYKGQKQRWFLLRFLGQDSDINIETEDAEFCAWQWADAKDLPGLIVPFKQQLYQELLDEFGELIGL